MSRYRARRSDETALRKTLVISAGAALLLAGNALMLYAVKNPERVRKLISR